MRKDAIRLRLATQLQSRQGSKGKGKETDGKRPASAGLGERAAGNKSWWMMEEEVHSKNKTAVRRPASAGPVGRGDEERMQAGLTMWWKGEGEVHQYEARDVECTGVDNSVVGCRAEEERPRNVSWLIERGGIPTMHSTLHVAVREVRLLFTSLHLCLSVKSVFYLESTKCQVTAEEGGLA